MNEHQKGALKFYEFYGFVASAILAIGGLILWLNIARPDYRIVARAEPGGITRYVIESRIIGGLYGRNWQLTSFSLPDAKATVARLVENDRIARERNQAKWRVVE